MKYLEYIPFDETNTQKALMGCTIIDIIRKERNTNQWGVKQEREKPRGEA